MQYCFNDDISTNNDSLYILGGMRPGSADSHDKDMEG
jgi:hypothetical protein